MKDQASAPEISQFDPKVVTRTHYNELERYLATYLAKSPANSRLTARQKLSRLTKQQFQELSTDVYDELIRRKMNTPENQMPYLPVCDEFHPKRNQARQKLATLLTARFEDLSSDVHFELSRRYPELKDKGDAGMPPVGSPGSAYDDMPSPEFHASLRLDASTLPLVSRIARTSNEGGGNSASLLGGPPPDGFVRHRPSDDEMPPRRSDNAYGSDTNPFGPPTQPFQDRVAPSLILDFDHRPSASASIHSDSTDDTVILRGETETSAYTSALGVVNYGSVHWRRGSVKRG